MPIYAFACQSCGHAFDTLQRMSDPDPETCPACGEATIKRQLTAPSFRLAGAGWYETDFKKDGDRKRNIAGDGGDSKSGDSKGGDSKGGDSKGADSGSSSNDSSAKSETSSKGDASPTKDSGGAKESGKAESKPAKAEPAPAAKPAAPASKNP